MSLPSTKADAAVRATALAAIVFTAFALLWMGLTWFPPAGGPATETAEYASAGSNR